MSTLRDLGELIVCLSACEKESGRNSKGSEASPHLLEYLESLIVRLSPANPPCVTTSSPPVTLCDGGSSPSSSVHHLDDGTVRVLENDSLDRVRSLMKKIRKSTVEMSPIGHLASNINDNRDGLKIGGGGSPTDEMGVVPLQPLHPTTTTTSNVIKSSAPVASINMQRPSTLRALRGLVAVKDGLRKELMEDHDGQMGEYVRILRPKMAPREINSRMTVAASLFGMDRGERIIDLLAKRRIPSMILICFLWSGCFLGALSIVELIPAYWSLIGGLLNLFAVITGGYFVMITELLLMLILRFDTW